MILSSDNTVRLIPQYMVIQLPRYKFKRGELMILSSDDNVRPIPRYKVIQLPRYGRGE